MLYKWAESYVVINSKTGSQFVSMADKLLTSESAYSSKWVGFDVESRCSGYILFNVEETTNIDVARYVPRVGSYAYYINCKGEMFKIQANEEHKIYIPDSFDGRIMFPIEDLVVLENYYDGTPPFQMENLNRFIFLKFTPDDAQAELYVKIKGFMISDARNDMEVDICTACFCHFGPYRVKDAEARGMVAKLREDVEKSVADFNKSLADFNKSLADYKAEVEDYLEAGEQVTAEAVEVIATDLETLKKDYSDHCESYRGRSVIHHSTQGSTMDIPIGYFTEPTYSFEKDIENYRICFVNIRDYGDILCLIAPNLGWFTNESGETVTGKKYIYIDGHGAVVNQGSQNPLTGVVHLVMQYDEATEKYFVVHNNTGVFNPITDQMITELKSVTKIELIV